MSYIKKAFLALVLLLTLNAATTGVASAEFDMPECYPCDSK